MDRADLTRADCHEMYMDLVAAVNEMRRAITQLYDTQHLAMDKVNEAAWRLREKLEHDIASSKHAEE